jgi:aspartyl-tRNA(Asn)/glutamyl-tRNA(Gln) amidotransferase subunit A
VTVNRLSASDILEQHLARIHREEPLIQAWATLATETSREQARKLDSEDHFLPLAGEILGIKDIVHVAGLPTRAGSKFLGDEIESHDALCVSRLRKAGAIILGKTATTEFAFFDPAPTRNPRNPGHTPGGSSSGSAAAVAAGFCGAAIGTQTFGSVIRPASYCGVFGLKPTFDAIPRDGVIPFAPSLDHVGILARTPTLAARCADVLMDLPTAAEKPSAGLQEDIDLRRNRLRTASAGVPDRYFFSGLDTTVRTGFDAGLQALHELGVRVREVKLPSLFEDAVGAAGILMRAEAARSHRHWYAAHSELYGDHLRQVIEAGLKIPAVEYLEARAIQLRAQQEMQQLLAEVDFLVSPSTPTVAPHGLAWTGDPVFNTPFSVTGVPTITLPATYSADGLPSGFQVAGAPWSEAKLFRLALSLEENGFGRFQTPCFEWQEKNPNRT